MTKVLAGGSGYIGSHVVKKLGQVSCAVTTLGPSSGYREALLYGDFERVYTA